ncbi:translation initiation factor IF-3 [Nomia melanderi]|uniref:translation initiation factor IF-3 n=1 Tax=Nomia melanderi TaxID=2448451 RepID=UPI001304356D|nr:uncharacterized protein LOC116427627 [Nomia melanderi]
MLIMLRSLTMNIHMYRASSLLTSNNILQKICYNYLKFQTKFFNTDENTEEIDEKKKKTKTIRLPQIKLIYPDESITINFLHEAKKIAKRQGYELVKMPYIDSKTDREVYKLCTIQEFLDKQKNEDSNKHSDSVEFKKTKLFSIKSKITPHDLQIKVNHMNNLLEKRHRIKIIIMYSPTDKEEKEIQRSLKKNIKGKLELEKVKDSVTFMTFKPLLNESKNITESTVNIPQ